MKIPLSFLIYLSHFIIPLALLVVPIAKAEQYIPDTGQTESYTDIFGEDSDYIRNARSYTKLNSNGNPLPDSASSWAMVKDNVTGLTWEVKTDDDSIHDRDNTYTWQDAQDVFITELNFIGFGGFTDWRLPTRIELGYLVDYSRVNPSIDTFYFPQTVATGIIYWSCDPRLHPSYTDRAWGTNFDYGYETTPTKSFDCYVRAVR